MEKIQYYQMSDEEKLDISKKIAELSESLPWKELCSVLKRTRDGLVEKLLKLLKDENLDYGVERELLVAKSIASKINIIDGIIEEPEMRSMQVERYVENVKKKEEAEKVSAVTRTSAY